MVQLSEKALGNARPNHMPIGRALLSVSDKTGLLDLAKALHELGP